MFSIYTSVKACGERSVVSMVTRRQLPFTPGEIIEMKKKKGIHGNEFRCAMIWLSNQHSATKCDDVFIILRVRDTEKKSCVKLFSIENTPLMSYNTFPSDKALIRLDCGIIFTHNSLLRFTLGPSPHLATGVFACSPRVQARCFGSQTGHYRSPLEGST